MSRSIWVTRLLSGGQTQSRGVSCKGSHGGRTHAPSVIPTVGRSSFISAEALRGPQRFLSTPPSSLPLQNPLSIQTPLWSGRLQPECYRLRAYNVSSPPVLDLSSSPDVCLLLVVKRQALDQREGVSAARWPESKLLIQVAEAPVCWIWTWGLETLMITIDPNWVKQLRWKGKRVKLWPEPR